MWFHQMKKALHRFYSDQYPANVVGYLRGSDNPSDWLTSAAIGRHQALILGNVPPTAKDWTDAGVPHRRGAEKTILIENISGWIVLQNGGSPRPWGQLFLVDQDCLKIGFPASLAYWMRNFP